MKLYGTKLKPRSPQDNIDGSVMSMMYQTLFSDVNKHRSLFMSHSQLRARLPSKFANNVDKG